jgi:hypothetical protein
MIVENYPLVPRSLDELEHMRHIIERRRIEIGEKKLRRQILSDNSMGFETGNDMASVNPSFPTLFL